MSVYHNPAEYGCKSMSKKECHLIPEEEKRCVWMTTGLISYKLCARDYRCESCMFDQVMRNEAAADGSRQEAGTGEEPSSLPEASLHLRWSLFYHPGHCWVKVEDPENVRIGIDDVLTRLMVRLKAVVLPQEGEMIRQGECCAHIIQEHHIIPVIAPLTGTIQLVNKRLQKEPELIMSAPWDEGWMVTVKPATLEHDLRNLLFGKKALAWYQQKHQELTAAGTAMLQHSSNDLGPTLQDGGVKINSLAELLSAEQYYQIIDSLSRSEDCPSPENCLTTKTVP
jgi:glycine cleavage system H protein